MRDPYDPDRLAEAAHIVDTFIPGGRIVVAPRSGAREMARLVYPAPDLPEGHECKMDLIPSACGSHASGSPGDLRFGGTVQDALATLVRFVRGRTRRPMLWWRMNFSDKTIQAIISTSYPDKTLMCCVLCGNESAGLDWWSDPLGNKQGPCCFGGDCSRSSANIIAGDIYC